MKIIIYKLLCNKTNNCYIGSTKRKLNDRISQHKSAYKNNNGLTKSVEILKNEDYQVIILEEFEINTLDELKNQYLKEREYIEKELNCINKNIPIRTEEEIKKYYENNKIIILKKRAERYIKNRDKELSRQNSYYLDPIKKERIKKYNLERYYRLKLLSSQ
jgi:predicted GIY-YIG superfamily endonuclease